jgi:hypothetical protein
MLTRRNFAFYSSAAFLVGAMLCAMGIRTDTGNTFFALTLVFLVMGVIGFLGFLLAPKRRQEPEAD